MYSKIISQEPFELVTLQEAKDQPIVEFDDDDVYIEGLMNAASEAAQNFTGRLMSKSVVATFSNKKSFFLPYLDVHSIDTVKVTGDDVSYDYDPISEMITITDDSVYEGDRIDVTFTAGYKEGIVSIPHVVKMGVLMIISTFYEHREDFIAGLNVSEVPMNSKDLLKQVKVSHI